MQVVFKGRTVRHAARTLGWPFYEVAIDLMFHRQKILCGLPASGEAVIGKNYVSIRGISCKRCRASMRRAQKK